MHDVEAYSNDCEAGRAEARAVIEKFFEDENLPAFAHGLRILLTKAEGQAIGASFEIAETIERLQ